MQTWMTGNKAKFMHHQPGVCIAIMGVRKVSQRWAIMFLLEVICVILLFLATGCLFLVYREVIECYRNAKNLKLS